MGNYENNIPLTKKDLEKIRRILKNKKFEEFEIHPYYYRGKFTGKQSRHGISIQELKKIYEKPESIVSGFKRKMMRGFGYTLIYKISTNMFMKICYLLNDSLRIFNAIPIKTNLEKSVPKRYGLRI